MNLSDKMKLLVFVSPGCPHCPAAESVARRVAPEYNEFGLYFKKVRTRTDEGKRLSSMYRIMATPTILLVNDEGEEKKRIVGTPSESSLKNEIEKALGLKKSFFGKIFGKK